MRLGENVGGEFVRQVMLADYNFGVHADIAGTPKNFDHATRRSQAAFRKSRELHVHYRAIEFGEFYAAAGNARTRAFGRGHLAHFFFQLGQEFLAWRNYDFVQDARVVGMHGIALRAVAEKSDDRRMLALDDLHNAPVGAAIIAAALDARENGVAVHRVANGIATNEKIAVHFRLLLGRDYEAVAIAMRDETPADQIRIALR